MKSGAFISGRLHSVNEFVRPLLQTKDLSVGYGALPVLRDVCIDINEGEAVAILGPNGHGKTTLMRTISGLLKPERGHVLFDGEDITRLSANNRRCLGIGHVPQGDLLFADMSVQENMAAGAYERNAWRSRRKNIAKNYALFPELELRKNAPAGALSGGERRMLAIARAIMTPSRVLLVDEPSIGLAPSAIVRLYQALHHLKDNGVTILLVEETLSRIEGFADRVYLLDHGQIVSEATPIALSQDKQLRKTYLG